MKIKAAIGLVVSILGVFAMTVALAAEFMGIDRGGGWGPARLFLFMTGLLLALLPPASALAKRILARWNPPIFPVSVKDESSLPMRSGDQIADIGAGTDREHPSRPWVAIVALCMLLAAASTLTWLISVGRWHRWPQSTDYYHLLAEGFRAGETHLLVEPPPALLSLENPYDPTARESIPYIWDVSLYDGKYYLYWGPAPALAVVLFESLLHTSIGDNLLVWSFAILTIGVMLVIAAQVWRRFFSHLPGWAFLPVALVVAFIDPLTWMMSRPAVYEAAIASGQFFLMFTILIALPTLWDDDVPAWRYWFASTCGGFAIASRVILLPAVTIVLAFTAWRLYKASSGKKTFRLALLLTPILMISIGLAWYNYDRFGSIFELGHRYQLGRWNKFDAYGLVASLANIPLNLKNYFLNSVRTIQVFPYVKPTWGSYAIPSLRIAAVENYHTEKVTGVLITTPFILLGLLPFVGMLHRFWHNLDALPQERHLALLPIPETSLRRLFLLLLAIGLAALGPLLVLSVNSMRHVLDFLPALLLLSAIGYGQALQEYRYRKLTFRVLLLTAALFAIISVALSFLLAITGYDSQFERINPDLFDRATRFLTW